MIPPYQLPYTKDQLKPFLSEETVTLHFEKHHKGYLNKLNKAIEGTAHASQSLVEIVRSAQGGIFNNAAQVYNHNFQWSCIRPESDKKPTGNLAAKIQEQFDSFDEFKAKFKKTALGQFGSGWAWLVRDELYNLHIVSTDNASTPITEEGITPILTLDVWEHAYYVDYRNDRGAYVDQFWNFVNWEFANEQFES